MSKKGLLFDWDFIKVFLIASNLKIPKEFGENMDMDTENRKKAVKHHLIDVGISFREWCRREGVPHSVARDLVYGRLDGSRAEKTLQVKEILEKEFGKEIFS